MKKIFPIYKLILSFLILLSTSCKKENPITPTPPKTLSGGYLILNEGLFQYNNANLAWYSSKDNKLNSQFFESKTSRNLGDTGNDLKQYGNKLYVLTNVSGTLEILNASTGDFIKQIDFKNNGVNKQPRYITFYKNKAYISCFDGYVDVIDTSNLALEKRIKVGSNPDHILTWNEKIYVSNSGGLNAPIMDSTISVIDPNSNQEIEKIVVGKNPGQLLGFENELFVTVRGNYSNSPSCLKRVNLNNKEVYTFPDIKPIILEKMNQNILIYGDFNHQSKVKIYNTKLNTWENNHLLDVFQFTTLYSIKYIEKINKLYFLDANEYTITGKIFEFDLLGNKLDEFSSGGLIPSTLLFFE